MQLNHFTIDFPIRIEKSTITSQRSRFLLLLLFSLKPNNSIRCFIIQRNQFIPLRAFLIDYVTSKPKALLLCYIRLRNRRTHHRLLIFIQRILHVDLSFIRIIRLFLQSNGYRVDSINRMGPTGHMGFVPSHLIVSLSQGHFCQFLYFSLTSLVCHY